MIAYSIFSFVIAALFLALGIAIYQGNTKLIHDYHQTNVRECERKEYGRAFAKGIFAISATLLISSMIALFGKDGAVVAASLIVLFAGLVVSILILVKVQRKYNGGF